MTENPTPEAPGIPEGDSVSASAPPPDAPTEHERLPRPRIRIGAVLWGVVLVAVAGGLLWIATSPARRADALAAVLDLDPLGWTVAIVVALGGLITLLALAAVIRRLQARAGGR